MKLRLLNGFLIFFLTGIAYALTPVNNTFEDKGVETEFNNLYENAQGAQFKIVGSTPILSELRDGEVVILSTGAYTKLLYRANQEVYSINVSCITVYR